MCKSGIVTLSILLLSPVAVVAQNKISEKLFDQLKTSITQSCENEDYLNCIESNDSICHKIAQTQLEKIGEIFDTQSQAIADGKISELLVEIKKARSMVLEENNIPISKANSCGKQFLIN